MPEEEGALTDAVHRVFEKYGENSDVRTKELGDAAELLAESR